MSGEAITAVGTDGSRLAVQSVAAKNIGGHQAENVIIPQSFLQQLLPALKKGRKNVDLTVRDGHIDFRFGSRKLSARLLEGRFPRWCILFPTHENMASIDFIAGELLSVLRQSSPVSDIEIALENSHFSLRVKGTSRIRRPLAPPCREFRQTFDPKFFIDVLNVLDRNIRISLFIGNDDIQ